MEFDLCEAFLATTDVYLCWKPSFRNSIKPPSAFMKDIRPQVGDSIYFQGKFMVSIEACPKCGGKGSIDCKYCLAGRTQKTVLQEKITPDGKKFLFPGQIQIPCPHCNGVGQVPCDHYIAPRDWNPASSADKARWVVGQLRFSRADLLKGSNFEPKELSKILYNLARDSAYALCFHLTEMEVGIICQGKKHVIIKPQKSD